MATSFCGWHTVLLTSYLQAPIERDLGCKMVFVGEPRQVGKKRSGPMITPDPTAYLNYDIAEHCSVILNGELPATPAWASRITEDCDTKARKDAKSPSQGVGTVTSEFGELRAAVSVAT